MELPPLSLEEAEAIHVAVMEEYPEEPSGVLDRGLLALGPCQSPRFRSRKQAHATAISFFFLERAGYRISAPDSAVLEIVYAVDSGEASIETVAEWFRRHTTYPE